MFEQLLHIVPDGIVAVDTRGQIVFANKRAEAMFGYDPGTLIGQSVETLVPERFTTHDEQRRAYAEDPHDMLMGQGRVLAARRRDGTEFPSEIAIAVLEATPYVTLHVAAVRDVTDRAESEREQRLQRELDHARRLETVGQLAGGIAHDFNNLLAIILNLCDVVDTELPDGQDVLREDVAEIRGAAERGAALTRQLLLFSRRDVAQREAMSLDGVIDELATLMRRALGQRVTLIVEHVDGLQCVVGDRGQLEQVLLNLAVNSRDAMPDGGRLTITTENVEVDEDLAALLVGVAPGAYVRLTVRDTGSGMPTDVAERAFEPFFSTKPQGQGTGLGLATVYGIVTENGGHVSIDSVIDEGTAIEILLPACEPGARQDQADGS